MGALRGQIEERARFRRTEGLAQAPTHAGKLTDDEDWGPRRRRLLTQGVTVGAVSTVMERFLYISTLNSMCSLLAFYRDPGSGVNFQNEHN